MALSRIDVDKLPLGAVNPERDTPLYLQIEADLRHLIRSGELSSGLLMPTELELSQAYGVGRQTVRMALSRLAADDLIARQAGKGTIIKPQTQRRQFYLDRSFTRQMAEMGQEAHAKVLSKTVRRADPSLPRPFHDYLGQPYLHLTRLRFGNEEPVALQSARVMLTRCPGLEDEDFDKASLYEVLSRRYELLIEQIDHTISATPADELQAGLLQVPVDAPLLVVTTTAFLSDDQLIEQTVSYYRADKYEYHTSHRYQKG